MISFWYLKFEDFHLSIPIKTYTLFYPLYKKQNTLHKTYMYMYLPEHLTGMNKA